MEQTPENLLKTRATYITRKKSTNFFIKKAITFNQIDTFIDGLEATRGK
jgi:hypothetical protein